MFYWFTQVALWLQGQPSYPSPWLEEHCSLWTPETPREFYRDCTPQFTHPHWRVNNLTASGGLRILLQKKLIPRGQLGAETFSKGVQHVRIPGEHTNVMKRSTEISDIRRAENKLANENFPLNISLLCSTKCQVSST